jgi:hypothetical protein
MASSDLLDTNRIITEAEPDDTSLDKRVCLPKPDVNNITVLTESLPNEPILPWHHFDSPWLEKEDEGESATPEPDEAHPPTDPVDDGTEQLSLPLDGATVSLAEPPAPPTLGSALPDAETDHSDPTPPAVETNTL